MQNNEAAACLESLGNPTRLDIFRVLVQAGPDGLPVGEIQTRLDIPGSTLSHHVAHLVNHRLVDQEREGRVLRCRPNFAIMAEIVGYLTENCCQESGCC